LLSNLKASDNFHVSVVFVEGRKIKGPYSNGETIFYWAEIVFLFWEMGWETIVGDTHTKHTIKINSSQLNLLFH